MTVNIILVLLGMVTLIGMLLLIVDVYAQGYLWQSRIKIGRVLEPAKHKALVEQCAHKWFKKTPTVKLTDNNRLVLLDILKGNFKRSTIQHWQKAGLILGLRDSGKLDNVQVQNLMNQTHPNQIPKEADYVIYAYALLYACNDQQRGHFKPYFDAVYDMVLALNKQNNGVSYKTYSEPFKYVDTIGFICPYLTLYANVYQVSEAADLAYKQIALFRQYGMYPGTQLPCHTYNSITLQPVGLFGWGRGLGWLAIGLIDTWLLWDKKDERYKEISNWVYDFNVEILKTQKEDGSWTWNVLLPTVQSDSSAGVMLTYYLSQAKKLPSLEEKNIMAINRALEYLRKVTRRNGALDFCQGDTKGIGIYAQTFDILPFAQGYLLRILNNII